MDSRTTLPPPPPAKRAASIPPPPPMKRADASVTSSLLPEKENGFAEKSDEELFISDDDIARAENGDLSAQILCGSRYYLGIPDGKGIRVGEDKSKAFHWYHKAAEQGSQKAAVLLATMYDFGIGVKADEEKAIFWINQALDQEEPVNRAQRMTDIANFYTNHHRADWFGFDGGIPEGRFQGDLKQGISSCEVDLPSDKWGGAAWKNRECKASFWYLKAAELGDAIAQYEIGTRYYDFDGVQVLAKDKDEAIRWLKKAAKEPKLAEHVEAALKCIQLNLRHANTLALKERRQGTVALYGYLLVFMAIVAFLIDTYAFNGFYRYHWIGGADSPSAQFALGYGYDKGRWPVAKNEIEAVKWYRKAAEQGNESAKIRLESMSPK